MHFFLLFPCFSLALYVCNSPVVFILRYLPIRFEQKKKKKNSCFCCVTAASYRLQLPRVAARLLARSATFLHWLLYPFSRAAYFLCTIYAACRCSSRAYQCQLLDWFTIDSDFCWFFALSFYIFYVFLRRLTVCCCFVVELLLSVTVTAARCTISEAVSIRRSVNSVAFFVRFFRL